MATTLKFGNPSTAFSNHLPESRHLNFRDVFVCSCHFESQACRKILFVADHHIHVFCDLAIHLLRFLLPADAFPQRWTIIEIVGDNRAMFLRGLNGLDHQLWRRLAQRGKNAAGVKPANAELAKNMFPIKIARLQLAGGGMPTIGNSDRAAKAKAALSEIQSVANRRANAVVTVTT